jgi:uncharacterized protein (TIGR00251 family)
VPRRIPPTPDNANSAAAPPQDSDDDAASRAAIARDNDGAVLVRVHVIPRAGRESIELADAALRVRLTAPPIEGTANSALIALLAARLRLPRRAVTIERGATSRDKVVAVAGLTPADFWSRLGL